MPYRPFPRKDKALADWVQMRALKVTGDETLAHFREQYPERFGDCRSYDTLQKCMYSYLRRAELDDKMPEVPPATLTYHEMVPELNIPFYPHLAVLSDPHASAHSDRGVARFVKAVEALQIPVVIVNGDLFDNAYLGHKGIRNARSATAAENIFAGANILNALTRAGVKVFYVIQGNHDDKPLRGTDRELLYSDWWRAQVEPHLDDPGAFTVTHRYYLTMDPMERTYTPSKPEHFPTRFTHQREYGRAPLGVAMRLADVLMMNVVTGHQHHLAMGRHKSGKFWIADAGTLQHSEGAEYKVNRDTTHPEWSEGFLTLHWGVPRPWFMTASDEWWADALGVDDGVA